MTIEMSRNQSSVLYIILRKVQLLKPLQTFAPFFVSFLIMVVVYLVHRQPVLQLYFVKELKVNELTLIGEFPAFCFVLCGFVIWLMCDWWCTVSFVVTEVYNL